MKIPAYLNRNDTPPPAPSADEPSRYIVAENDTFIERHSPMFSTAVRVNPYSLNLARYDEYCVLRCGTIPRILHRAMLSFFKRAYRIHGGEAALVLLYHPIRRAFRWYCPEQVVDMYESRTGWFAGDTIAYSNPLTLPDGYVLFGDAHLHVGAAIPSQMDLYDDGDGLHIIVGNIRSEPTYHIDFVMDGRRFPIEPESLFDDPGCTPFASPPRAWLRRIHLRRNYYAQQTY